MTAASPSDGIRTERGRSAHAVPSTQASYLRSAVLPAAVIGVACVAAAVAAVLAAPSGRTSREVLAGVAVGVAAMVVAAFLGARAASRRMEAQLQASRVSAQRGQAELQQLTERVMRGEHERSDQRVEIFVNLARRMQSLVHREIEMLDDLEAQVEDPDLLKGLFTVDHLATRLRRQSESLAVLGGSSSRRQWTRQVTMHEVLRAAVAEVEQYSRVKVVPPVEGVLRGAAVTDIIHLIAELVENATKFSAPHTIALLRAQHVSAGIAIEVDDRGLGMVPADQQRMNVLLADPGRTDVGELLRDGRIGLYVVAALARRHGVRVQLQNNIYGGTQAVVILPRSLLDAGEPLPPATAPAAAERDPRSRFALVPAGGPADLSAGSVAAASAGSPAGVSGDRPTGYPLGDQDHPALPVRRPASGASSSAGSWQPAADGGAGPGTRPALPRRQGNSEPDAPPREYLSAEPAGPDQPADQMTGLMADFLKGVNRAEDGDSSARG